MVNLQVDAAKLLIERGADVNQPDSELGETPLPLSAPYREAAEALYRDFYSIIVDEQQPTDFTQALARLG